VYSARRSAVARGTRPASGPAKTPIQRAATTTQLYPPTQPYWRSRARPGRRILTQSRQLVSMRRPSKSQRSSTPSSIRRQCLTRGVLGSAFLPPRFR
jgi:hypothetical protein